MLLKGLARVCEPEKGQILCNGKDISDVDVYTYRKYLSLVAQEPTLVQGQYYSLSPAFLKY